ncbi:FmdB family zinc ribbon protein [Waddlia chondrophila]|uniref:Putative regulatory protein FmdB zinc ribbon domain-containing protein n=1 Tax=Waddlia chondrophila (strain ATCC VR-1470 / WSU 86-1044) TaxID=716544 RepID=D6YSZ4_WADCW|nr:FmdB family zinc ribbon protein [Waddlia chondrophila]ADI39189.1 conserved hypothetical protein [Waddlia chondrophila WSU 86-1044]
MPTYAYICETCKHQMDAFQKITDFPLKECPKCAAPTLRRGPGGGIGLSFKGSGFYITDYSQKQECPSSCGKEGACKQV